MHREWRFPKRFGKASIEGLPVISSRPCVNGVALCTSTRSFSGQMSFAMMVPEIFNFFCVTISLRTPVLTRRCYLDGMSIPILLDEWVSNMEGLATLAETFTVITAITLDRLQQHTVTIGFRMTGSVSSPTLAVLTFRIKPRRGAA